MKSYNLLILTKNNIPVPSFTAIGINDSWNDELAKKVKDLGHGPYAVRSSAGMEDSKTLSFAGQFYTALNVLYEDLPVTIEDVADKIKDYSAKEYANTSESTELDSNIIIQQMIDSKLSGVMFTANPMNLLNEVVITVGRGLGENVVSDKTQTTTYYYNTTDNVYYSDNQLIELADDKIRELVDYSQKIKSIFQDNMDIEFAIDKDNRLWILQARAITTLDTSKVITLDSSNIAESYPGVTLPLSQGFISDMYTTVFKNCVLMISNEQAFVDKLDDNFNNMVAFVNGRAYYQIDNFYELFKLVPFSNRIIKIWQNSLGVRNPATGDAKITVSTFKKWSNIKKLISMMKKSPEEMDKLEDFFSSRIDSYRKQVDACTTIPELLSCYESIKEDLGYKWGITLVNDLYAFWYTHRVRDKQQIADIAGMESMKPTLLMNRLIDAYGSNSSEFEELFSEYIDLYSDRCIGELKLETKTYRTNPELLREYIASHSKADVTMAKEDTNPSRLVAKAKLGIKNRESSRMNRTRIFGIVRSIYLKIGEILVAQDKLDDKRDVFYLTRDQLTQDKLRDIVRREKAIYSQYEKLPYFSRLEFAGDIYDFNINVGEARVMLDDNSISGTPTSAGECMAEAIIIDQPSDDLDVTGKIIVTKSTDPGWVILVKNCAGIIAEQGSILSHTAIITRELKKPSIVNVKNATSVIKNGDKVWMSGNTGVIKINE